MTYLVLKQQDLLIQTQDDCLKTLNSPLSLGKTTWENDLHDAIQFSEVETTNL